MQRESGAQGEVVVWCAPSAQKCELHSPSPSARTLLQAHWATLLLALKEICPLWMHLRARERERRLWVVESGPSQGFKVVSRDGPRQGRVGRARRATGQMRGLPFSLKV